MHIDTSIRKLGIVLMILFIAMTGSAVYWQVGVAESMTANIHNGRKCMYDQAPIRGRIFDRNGVLLAESKPEKGICGYLRHYYEPSLSGIIGYYISPLYNSTGIERQFDDYLSGRVGTDKIDNEVNSMLHRPPVGNDLYLTIDVRIQRLVNQHFDDPVKIDNNDTYESKQGSIIVSDPHTGDILAMLSRPFFDANQLVKTVAHGDLSYQSQLENDPSQPLLVRPIQGRYVPGSTYKTLTLLAGLDTGNTTLDQNFDERHARGPLFFNGYQVGPDGNNIEGYTKKFPVTTEYAFTHSDNVIFADIGSRTGGDKWLDYNKRFYVEGKIPFDLPIAKSIVLKPGKNDLDENELAADAFGQGYDFVTPMQMLVVDNAIANDGKLMRPRLVLKATNQNKELVTSFNPQLLSTPITSKTATDVRQAMYGVIRCGTGAAVRAFFTDNTGVIGKTGTAQVSTGAIPPHGWLVTQAPYSLDNPSQLPSLTIVGLKENGGEGGLIVGPMLAHMYKDIFSQGLVKYEQPTQTDRAYCCKTQLLQENCMIE